MSPSAKCMEPRRRLESFSTVADKKSRSSSCTRAVGTLIAKAWRPTSKGVDAQTSTMRGVSLTWSALVSPVLLSLTVSFSGLRLLLRRRITRQHALRHAVGARGTYASGVRTSSVVCLRYLL